MKKGKIDNLCAEYNNKMGLIYPAPGCIAYADYTGCGEGKRKLYRVINASGGVSLLHECKNTRDAVKLLQAMLAECSK